jgi:hypothetical protein
VQYIPKKLLMVQTFTPTDLILYLYNETVMTDSVLIQKSIDTDPAVELEYDCIKEAANLIDKALSSPSENSIRSILAYARTGMKV